MTTAYVDYFPQYIQTGIEAGLLDPELATFDLTKLASAIKPERDLNFAFLGLQTLYDRYLLHIDKVRFELPQAFFLRVAMGISLKEENREERAIEFYELLSSFRFMSSTPTLFNSGTTRPQLSLVLPDHGRRRPGRHLRGYPEQRAAGQVLRGPGQRLDSGPRHRREDPRYQRRVAGRRAVPQDRQRHRRRGEPGRQA